MTVFVTGATGMVGSRLVSVLNREGIEPRALVRPGADTSNLEGLRYQTITGDLADRAALLRGVDGCDWVFHCAATIAMWAGARAQSEAVNVEGTRAIVEVAIQAGVGRLIHTSSVATVGYRTTPGLLTEDSAYNYAPWMTYQGTKRAAEELVIGAAREGRIDAVALNPVLIVGPADIRLNAGQLFRMASHGWMRIYPRGGCGVVDPDDVAEAHLQAAHKGKTASRYLLCGENLTHRDLLALIARSVGRSPPQLPLPGWMVRGAGHALQAAAGILGRRPLLSVDQAFSSSVFLWADSTRARVELGFQARDAAQCVAREAAWMKSRGLL